MRNDFVQHDRHHGEQLPKGPLRRCGDDGKWKGKLGFCKPLNCPPLAPPANGSVSPASCGTGEAAPNQHCYFTCNPGFRVSGNPVRVCLPSLKWNPQRPPPSCEKGEETQFLITQLQLGRVTAKATTILRYFLRLSRRSVFSSFNPVCLSIVSYVQF